MPEFLSIEVTGIDPLRQLLAAALPRLEQPADLMRVLGNTLRGNIERRFDTKTDPSGERWADWADSTKALYARADTPSKGKDKGTVVKRGTLLERTGQMRNSLAVNAGDDFVEVGMTRPTKGGQWQIPLLDETGTARMPRRGIFFADWESGTLGAQDSADLDADLVDYLDGIFGPG